MLLGKRPGLVRIIAVSGGLGLAGFVPGAGFTRANAQSAPAAQTPDSPARIAAVQRKQQADALRTQGKLAEAQIAYKDALRLAQPLGDALLTGKIYNNMAMAYLPDDHKQALECNLKAWELFHKAAPAGYEALSLSAMSSDYYYLRDFAHAETAGLQALDLYERLNDRGYVLATLNNLDAISTARSPLETRREYHERALLLRRKYQDVPGVALSERNLGLWYLSHLQYDEALPHYQAALPVLVAQKDADAQLFAGTIYGDIGVIYYARGRFEESLKACEEAEAILARLDPAARAPVLGALYRNMSAVYMALSRPNDALNMLKQAQRYTTGDAEDQALLEINLGMSAMSLKQFGTAEQHTKKALQICPTDYIKGLSYANLGMLELVRERYGKGRDYLLKTIPFLQKQGDLDSLARVYGALSSAAFSLRNDKAAKEYGKLAVAALESAGGLIRDPAGIGWFQNTFLSPYQAEAAALLALGLPDEALMMVERGRGQGLAAQAARNGVSFAALLTPEDRKKWALAANTMRQAATQSRVGDLAHRSETQRQWAQIQFNQAFQRFRQLQQAGRGRDPRLNALLGVSVSRQRLNDLARRHPDTLYLEWAVRDDGTTLLFALDGRGGKLRVQGWTLPVGKSRLRGEVKTWLAKMREAANQDRRDADIADQQKWQAADKQEKKLAQVLYNDLFAPVERAGLLDRTQNKHLVFVADDALLSLPFAALRDKSGRYLGDRFPLSQSVSLSLLAVTPPPRSAPRSLFYAADPYGGLSDSAAVTLASLPRRAGKESKAKLALPYARRGVLAIAGQFPKATGLLGAAMQKQAVLDQMGEAAILVLATHGIANETDGLRSGLAMAPDGTNTDIWLRASEIADRPLVASLAILWGCDTGSGSVTSGEGLLGLPWAFLAAGCPSLVSTHWQVNDDPATESLMRDFLREVQQGKAKDEALQNAVRAMRRDPHHARPYWWAAFTLIGDSTPLPPAARR